MAASAAVFAAFEVGRSWAAGIPDDASALIYTGTLLGPDGAPLPGDAAIEIRLWRSQAGVGDQLCTTGPEADVALASGRFSLPLPAECAAAVKANPQVFVEVLVNGTSLGRSHAGAVPYAIEAGHATRANDADHATNADTATSATNANGLLADRLSALETAMLPLHGVGTIAASLQTIDVNPNMFLSSAGPGGCADAVGLINVVDCSCPTGSFVLSGGAFAGLTSSAFILESRAISATTWRITCSDGSANQHCSQYTITCSRLGPGP